jgi:RNA-directed DNA polymerase
MKSLTRFITTKLQLRVNEQKSAVARPWERKLLGFSFTNTDTPKRRIAAKAVNRFKERVRELTSRTRGVRQGADDRRIGPLSTGLDRLFRQL